MAVIQEAWIGGVSTRRVDELVQAMGLSGISRSTVSKLCKDIDERVGAFLERPLAGEWPYLWLDATYLKVREGGRIVAVAAIIAVAVDAEGRREIVGLHLGPSEAETFWSTFLKGLLRRGLRGVQAGDLRRPRGPQGGDPARARRDVAALPGALDARRARLRAQRPAEPSGACWRPLLRRRSLRLLLRLVAAALRQAFPQADQAGAHQVWRQVADQLRPRRPTLSALMDGSEHEVLAYLGFPAQHRAKLHSTNPLERLNKEVKRRADVVGIFPNEASITRLSGAVLLEANDEWQLQHRHMPVEATAELLAAEAETLRLPPLAA